MRICIAYVWLKGRVLKYEGGGKKQNFKKGCVILLREVFDKGSSKKAEITKKLLSFFDQ